MCVCVWGGGGGVHFFQFYFIFLIKISHENEIIWWKLGLIETHRDQIISFLLDRGGGSSEPPEPLHYMIIIHISNHLKLLLEALTCFMFPSIQMSFSHIVPSPVQYNNM